MKFSASLFVATILTITQIGNAQVLGAGGSVEKANTEFIPASAFVAAVAFPKKIAENPSFQLFPHEIVTAWGKKELGFDPMLIRQITWIMQTPNSFTRNEQPLWAAVLSFEEMQGLAGTMIDPLEKKTIGGKSVFSGQKYGVLSFLVFDESTIIVGEEGFFESLLTASRTGKLVDLFKNSNVKGQALVSIDVAAIRHLIDEFRATPDMQELEKQIEDWSPVEDLKKLHNLLDSIVLGVNAEGTLETTLVMHATNIKAAEEVDDIIVKAMEFGAQALLTQMSSSLDLNDPVQAATISYAHRMSEKYQTNLAPVVSGSTLTITLHEEILTAPYFVAFVGSMRYAAAEGGNLTGENQLRQTAIAMHNYESAYGKFPPQTLNDDNGKPLLSGRVALLPFVDQNETYELMQLDEPWDSKHNLQFADIVIPVFGVDPTNNNRATVRFPVYPNSVWDNGGGKKISEITDGTSNTIGAFHAPPGSSIQWSNPEPWTLSRANPMADVFGDREEVLAMMLDGSTRVFKKSEMTNEKLKALLTISGGELIKD